MYHLRRKRTLQAHGLQIAPASAERPDMGAGGECRGVTVIPGYLFA